MADHMRAHLILLGFLLTVCACTGRVPTPHDGARLQPYAAHPFYWQFDGEPVLLIGGSDDDNPFQWSEGRLREHLGLLTAVGGNYIRNTMSSRSDGNAFPFVRLEDGRYDLTKWNEAYWNRLDRFLRLTREHGVIPQIEIWGPVGLLRQQRGPGRVVPQPLEPLQQRQLQR